MFDGPTHEAIVAYRRQLAGERDPEERAAGLKEWGGDTARVERVRLLGPDRDERMQLLAGEPFSIALDVVADTHLAPPRLGWELRDDAAILVDTVHRDGPPGTLYLLDVDPGDDAPAEPVEAHGLAPHRVLALVRALGGGPRRLRLVGCEPATPGADDDVTAGLSAAVAAAVEPAAALVASLVAELRTSAVPRA